MFHQVGNSSRNFILQQSYEQLGYKEWFICRPALRRGFSCSKTIGNRLCLWKRRISFIQSVPTQIPPPPFLFQTSFRVDLIVIAFLWHFRRYERLLRRAKTEDLSEVSGIGCLYQCGVDIYGRPVIIFVGKWFKFKEINLDKVINTFLRFWIIAPATENNNFLFPF